MYHYNQSKAAAGAEACIAVMSGHFLQRGEPAVVGKWARAEMALRMGADLVIELPVAYSSQPAEWFAYGAAGLLDATGVTDALCFGSEDGRIDPLLGLAEALHRESDAFRSRLKDELKTGASYPSAYAAAAAARRDVQQETGDGPPQAPVDPKAEDPESGGPEDEGGPEEPRLNQPNNILGLHYLMALRRLGSPIVPLTIPRQKADYHQTTVTDASIASATAIRKLLFGSGGGTNLPPEEALLGIAPYVPASTLDILRREFAAGRGPVGWEQYSRPLFAQLLGRSASELGGLCEVTEGLEHRIKRVLQEFPRDAQHPVEVLLQRLKTKRYTRTKLQRTLLRILLQHPKHELTRQKLSEGITYLRVLGFNEAGRELLKRMKKTAKVPVITKMPKDLPPFLDMDIRATSLYSLAYAEQSPAEWLRDYYEPPVQL